METENKLYNYTIEEFEALQKKIELFKEFHDLSEYNGRWSNFLSSQLVNNTATDVEIRPGCGCCSESILYAMPYVVRGKFTIYSTPAQIVVGNKDSDYDKPSPTWREDCQKHNIPDHIIEKIQNHFDHSRTEYEKSEEADKNECLN